MRVIERPLGEVLVLEPSVYTDERGFLFESFNVQDFEKESGVTEVFVQDNHSHSRRGVLRGLHYQVTRPHGKLVRAVSGEIFDVAVDLRKSSPTFGKWAGVRLSGTNHHQIWVPAGFAHGFLVLSESADVVYKTTDFYFPEYQRVLRWDDPALAIGWPLDGLPQLSAKDAGGATLAEAELFA